MINSVPSIGGRKQCWKKTMSITGAEITHSQLLNLTCINLVCQNFIKFNYIYVWNTPPDNKKSCSRGNIIV